LNWKVVAKRLAESSRVAQEESDVLSLQQEDLDAIEASHKGVPGSRPLVV
jgi:hypothetical protein